MDAVRVEDLTKKYGNSEVLKGVDLRIEEGEFYALMGPNGSGKTTFLLADGSNPVVGSSKIRTFTPEKSTVATSSLFLMPPE